MRVKVTNAKAAVIVQGPGTFLIRNATATAAIFLEVGSVPEAGQGEVAPLATEAEGAEWQHGAGTLEVRVAPQQALTGIAKAGEAPQEIHVLRNGPHY